MELVKNNKKYWNFIRELRNTGEGFVNQTQITPADQNEYMKKHGKDYFVCIEDGVPVGFIGAVDNDIRLAVDVQYRRKGIGRFMIDIFMIMKPDSTAKVKYNNTASINLFRSCGFFLTSNDDDFLYFKR